MSASLAQVQQAMSLYGLSVFLAFGTVGNVLLICILVQRTHRQNSCSLYLLSATVVNLILIECILPVAVYSARNVDPQSISLPWCKIRSYLFNALLMLYRWYKMAACVDRAAMCNPRAWIRSFSQARVARRTILIITIVWLLIPVHLAIFFRIENGRCVPETGAYAKFFSAYSIVISGWSPPIVMAIFGVISYRNLKQVRVRDWVESCFERRYAPRSDPEFIRHRSLSRTQRLANSNISTWADETSSSSFCWCAKC